MYYYITEAPRTPQQQKALEQTRELLTNLGISGEFVMTSPARGAEELAELGVAKRYSTIVAIGSDRLINEVASLLAGTPYIFGALPLHNPKALQLVTGITTIAEAAEALKFRRVRDTAIARIEPNKYFLSEVRMTSNSAIPIQLTINTATVSLDITDLRIAGCGTIVTDNRLGAGSSTKQWFERLIGRQQNVEIFASRFQAMRIVVESNHNFPVYLGSEVFARTPLAIEVIPNVLKMITKRDRLSPLQIDSTRTHKE